MIKLGTVVYFAYPIFAEIFFAAFKHHLAEFIHVLEVETEDAGGEPDAADRFAVEY